jgi:hypothetical protein
LGGVVAMKTSNAPFRLSNELLQNPLIKLSLISGLKRIFQPLTDFLSTGDKLQIWTTTDRYGNITWHVYDPISDRSVSRCSEVEMREWLEQRYYN